MAFSSKFHIGSTFDPERYDGFEKEAQYNYDLDRNLDKINEELPGRRQIIFNVRFRVHSAVKKMVTKTKSMISRFGSLQKSDEQPEVERGPTAISISSTVTVVADSTDAMNSPDACLPEKREKSPVNETEDQLIEMEDALSSDDANAQEIGYSDSPRRYRHKLPKEEKRPVIEEGFVERLVQWLEPKLSGSSSYLTPENSMSPQNSEKSKCIPSPSPPFCPSIPMRNSDLLGTSDEISPHRAKNVTADFRINKASESQIRGNISPVRVHATEVSQGAREADLKMENEKEFKDSTGPFPEVRVTGLPQDAANEGLRNALMAVLGGNNSERLVRFAATQESPENPRKQSADWWGSQR